MRIFAIKAVYADQGFVIWNESKVFCVKTAVLSNYTYIETINCDFITLRILFKANYIVP